jgi:hypothetical protein
VDADGNDRYFLLICEEGRLPQEAEREARANGQ